MFSLPLVVTNCSTTPLRLIKKRNYNKNKKNIFSHNLSKKKFELIYKSNFWSSKESVSGLGSEYKNTINLRNEMVKLIKNYKIESILDAPCGDFNWINSLINKNLKYIGGDIVSNLIEQNNKIYKNDNIIFIPLDITSDKLPNSNLMICRDCLIHLSFKNIKLFLENFRNSNINYLLLTSYKLKDSSKVIKNIDIMKRYLTPYQKTLKFQISPKKTCIYLGCKGTISLQRKGGDTGKKTSNQLQFKIKISNLIDKVTNLDYNF